MRKPAALSDLLAQLSGKGPQTHPHSEVLRIRAAMSFGMQLHGVTFTQFNRQFVEPYVGGADSKLGFRWKSGKTIASVRSARAIDTATPGFLEVYSQEFFSLLVDDPLSKRQITNLVGKWIVADRGERFWWFGDEYERARQFRCASTFSLTDVEALYRRSDVKGFAAILAQMRIAEAERNSELHIDCASYAYRLFASIARLPWLRPHYPLFRYCLQIVHMRDLLSWNHLAVNWSAIRAQIAASIHEVDIQQISLRGLDPPVDPVKPMVRAPRHRWILDPLPRHPGRKLDLRSATRVRNNMSTSLVRVITPP